MWSGKNVPPKLNHHYIQIAEHFVTEQNESIRKEHFYPSLLGGGGSSLRTDTMIKCKWVALNKDGIFSLGEFS